MAPRRTVDPEIAPRRSTPVQNIDQLVSDLYALSSNDMAVIEDTVRYGAPFRSARLPAERPPDQADVDAFCRYLVEMIQPFVDTATALRAFTIPPEGSAYSAPWRFIGLSTRTDPTEVSPAFLSPMVREGDGMSASRIVLVLPGGGLIIGLLNQRRFWSHSRARLCGLHVIRRHLNAF